jgi:ferredoxin
MKKIGLFQRETDRQKVMASAIVVPQSERCVQCGICNYNCPIGIDVRGHVWVGEPVSDSHCLTCGECVARCPRGVLSFKRTEMSSILVEYNNNGDK